MSEKPSGAKETILVVDDEKWILELVTEVLTKEGYTVLQAGNGEEALKICKNPGTKIDLLFSDMVMPKMDGVELGKQVSELLPEMKIIFTSAFPQHAEFCQRLADYGLKFLAKPYRLEHLIKTVDEVLHPV